MKFLIVGFGSIGRRHMRNLFSLGEQDVLLYRTHHSTLSDDELLGIAVETDLKKALQHRPDVVIVSNPTSRHLEVAIPAAEQGCHLLLEKPISHSLEGVEDLQAALQTSGSKALVGFQFRFHPGLQCVKRLLEEGLAGRPLSFRCQWGEYLPGWHPWEDYRKSYSARGDLGGGVVLTLSHPLDYLRWLFGEVASMWAFSGQISDLEIAVDDVGEIGLQYRSGVLGSLHLDYYRRPPVHNLEIVCSQGLIQWDNADGAVRLYRADTEAWEHYSAPQGFDRNDLFLDELRNMIAVARGDAEPACSLSDGIRALELALLVHQSAREKRLISL